MRRLIACEEGSEEGTTTTQYQPQQPTAPQQSTLAAAPTTETVLPATGGFAFLLPASVLLLGAGLIGMRLVRRS